jgi:hypothetical protein
MAEDGTLSRANACRIYDTLIGGAHLTKADEAAYQQLLTINPGTPHVARENRDYMLRACRTLAERYAVTQFLDLGCSYPTTEAPNLHEVVRRSRPDARVAYVDIEEGVEDAWQPIAAGDQHMTVVQADVAVAGATLAAVRAGGLLDFGEPIAIVLTGVLPFVPTDTDPWATVGEYRDATAGGSYLVLSHALTSEEWPEGAEAVLSMYREHIQPMFPRPERDVLRFFDGYTLLEPGLVPTPLWRPDIEPDPELAAFKRAVAGVGVKGDRPSAR